VLTVVCFNKLFCVCRIFVDGVGISILSSNDLFGALSYFSKRHSEKVFLVFFDSEHGWGTKVSTTSLFQQMKCVSRNYTILL